MRSQVVHSGGCCAVFPFSVTHHQDVLLAKTCLRFSPNLPRFIPFFSTPLLLCVYSCIVVVISYPYFICDHRTSFKKRTSRRYAMFGKGLTISSNRPTRRGALLRRRRKTVSARQSRLAPSKNTCTQSNWLENWH